MVFLCLIIPRLLSYPRSFLLCSRIRSILRYPRPIFHYSSESFGRIPSATASSRSSRSQKSLPNAEASSRRSATEDRWMNPTISEQKLRFIARYNKPNGGGYCPCCRELLIWALWIDNKTIIRNPDTMRRGESPWAAIWRTVSPWLLIW